MAALRELCRRLVIQRRMRALLVVPVAVLLAEYFCLQHGREGFAVEEQSPGTGSLKVSLQAFCHGAPGLM